VHNEKEIRKFGKRLNKAVFGGTTVLYHKRRKRSKHFDELKKMGKKDYSPDMERVVG